MSGYDIPNAAPAPAPEPEPAQPEAPTPEATAAPAPDASPEGPTAAAEPEQVEPPPPTASDGMHPLAVTPEEGLFAVPQPNMVKLLQKTLKLKYTAVLMYMNYGDRIRSHFRDSVYEHFQEHLKEERTACYDLAMKITALGGEPDVQVAKVISTASLHEIFMHIFQHEKLMIQAQRDVLDACGENTGLRLLIESSLLEDQRHLDDVRRMMVCEL